MTGRSWTLVRWLLAAQGALTGLAAGLTALITGPAQGLYVLAGGGIAMGLGVVFALRFFAVDAAEDPHGALRAMRRGVTAKMIGAVVIFGLAAKWLPQHVAQLIIGFGAATISYWLALLRAPLGDAPGPNEGN